MTEKERLKKQEQLRRWNEMQRRSAKKYNEKRAQRIKDGEIKPGVGKVKVKIKPMSDKKKKVVAQYTLMIAEKKQDFVKEHGYLFCEGCGRSDVVINPSHLIPQSRREDLICESKNVHFHCQERCHELCELGRWDEMNDGESIKEYIKENDLEYYNLKSNK